jgi:glycosyltransferase involved in cell wall biosynthesis
VAACLASIASDPYPRECREIVVADNGSTDDTVALAMSGGARIVSKHGGPVSALRNDAVRQSSGDLLDGESHCRIGGRGRGCRQVV